MSKIKIIIADDHDILLESLTLALSNEKEFDVVAGAQNGQELIQKVAKHNPDVVLLDLHMPLMNGVESMKRIKITHPNTRFIVLTMDYEKSRIIQLVENGCHSYLHKNVSLNEVIETIKMVVRHGYYFNDQIYKWIYEKAANGGAENSTPVSFTERELQIIRSICEENSNTEIAQEIHLSPRTIEGYRANIFEKTKMKSPLGLLKYTQEHHLLD